MPQDVASEQTNFDLNPPTKEQFDALVADLSDEERHVLLEHGTEAPFCGVFLDEKRARRLHLPTMRSAAFSRRNEVRERHGLAQLHPTVRERASQLHPRHQLRYGPDRDRLHPLRITPGPRLSGRSAAYRSTVLHQFREFLRSLLPASRCPTSSGAVHRRGSRRPNLLGLRHIFIAVGTA